ncbi:MAG: recombination regulator RecX [Proteobacteria bacterium]|nr:recombination regulator RecX [Pseudomonadota bacterium]
MRREHSRVELARKLAPHAESEEALELLLDELVQKKFLSEDRMAEARAHVLSRKYGASRVRHDLSAKGVAEETIERVAAEARSTELERALAIFRRKFREPAGTPQDRARRMRFLASRGFSSDTIRKVLAQSGKDQPGEETFD